MAHRASRPAVSSPSMTNAPFRSRGAFLDLRDAHDAREVARARGEPTRAHESRLASALEGLRTALGALDDAAPELEDDRRALAALRRVTDEIEAGREPSRRGIDRSCRLQRRRRLGGRGRGGDRRPRTSGWRLASRLNRPPFGSDPRRSPGSTSWPAWRSSPMRHGPAAAVRQPRAGLALGRPATAAQRARTGAGSGSVPNVGRPARHPWTRTRWRSGSTRCRSSRRWSPSSRRGQAAARCRRADRALGLVVRRRARPSGASRGRSRSGDFWRSRTATTGRWAPTRTPSESGSTPSPVPTGRRSRSLSPRSAPAARRIEPWVVRDLRNGGLGELDRAAPRDRPRDPHRGDPHSPGLRRLARQRRLHRGARRARLARLRGARLAARAGWAGPCRPRTRSAGRYADVVLDVAWALLEIRLHADPDRAPNDVWAEITGTYLGIAPHPEWSWWAIRGAARPGARVHGELRDRRHPGSRHAGRHPGARVATGPAATRAGTAGSPSGCTGTVPSARRARCSRGCRARSHGGCAGCPDRPDRLT